jgi:chorismate dehydratase
VVPEEKKWADPLEDVETHGKGRILRLGVFPYLVARPLIYGLDGVEYLDLLRVPPSRLKRLLAGGDVDVALMPTVDLPSFGRRLTVLTAGCLAGSGPTLMAKIYSQTRPEEISVLWADSNSHSFTVLVQAIWLSLYHRRISVVPFDSSAGRAPSDAQAVLLIGDRVVTDPPLGFERHFDPVAMWHEMTGLPFVAKVWATTRERYIDELYEMLVSARQRGQENLAAIAGDYGPAYGWPSDLAVRCLTREVQYAFTDAHREGMEEFLDLAAEHGLIESAGPLQYYKP